MSAYDEDVSIYNGITEVEVSIDRPVVQVWNKFLDMGSWVTSHKIEEISEKKRTLGAITRVSFLKAKELGFALAHYHYCKIVKLVPYRQYVLKTYSERGGSYGNEVIGFDDARFYESAGSTRVVFAFYGQIKGEMVAKDPASMNLEGSVEGMKQNLENLKRLVEQDSR